MSDNEFKEQVLIYLKEIRDALAKPNPQFTYNPPEWTTLPYKPNPWENGPTCVPLCATNLEAHR